MTRSAAPVPCGDGRTALAWIEDDGGRSAAGFRGRTGDCVTRAIAIATEQPYRKVYDALNAAIAERRTTPRATSRLRRASARTGVPRSAYEPYLRALGWEWYPTMRIGAGCRVHAIAEEVPPGRLILRLSHHLTAVVDRVIHDTYHPAMPGLVDGDGATRLQHRCVYGMFLRPDRDPGLARLLRAGAFPIYRAEETR